MLLPGAENNFSCACRSGASLIVVWYSETILRGSSPQLAQQEFCMRFMYIITSPQTMQTPSPALMEAVARISEREIKAGRLIENGGLMPLQTGARVRVADRKISVIDGPFVEAKEVIGGFSQFALFQQGGGAAVGEKNISL